MTVNGHFGDDENTMDLVMMEAQLHRSIKKITKLSTLKKKKRKKERKRNKLKTSKSRDFET